jgi:hypothetical protein
MDDVVVLSAPGFKTFFETPAGQAAYLLLVNQYSIGPNVARMVMVESFIGGVSSVKPPPRMAGHGIRGYGE